MESKKIVFTGGHHNSALVVAQECKKAGFDVYWFGHRHSMWGDTADSAEYKDVTAAGITFFDLRAGKLYRTYNPLKLVRVPLGFIHAFILLGKIRPNCIVSFGGYLGVPTVIAGRLLGIPSLTHEQTVTSGWANRVIGKFASRIAVSWPTSLVHYPKHKAVFTGLPIRPELLQPSIEKKKTSPLLYITGGKQGSHIINTTIFSILPQLKDYEIVHQTGTSTLFNDLVKAQEFESTHYKPFGYSNLLAMNALKQADVVVCRSGAHTVYELAILGKKSVLIPLPYASHNEQYKNALVLKKAGLGVILEEKDLSAESLLSAIEHAHALNGKKLDLPLDSHLNILQIIKQLCEKEKN